MKHKCVNCENLSCPFYKFWIWKGKEIKKVRTRFNNCDFFMENFYKKKGGR